jgi:ADP-ribose pyrophosphatase
MKSLEQKEKEKGAQIKTEWIYRGSVVSLKLDTYEIEGREKTFEIVKHDGAVVILPITVDGHILLIQQWRRATEEILLELPAGGLEEGEEPIDCARRELREETGFDAKKIVPFGGFYSAPGFTNEYLYLFLAKELYSAPLPPDDGEMIDLVPVTAQEAKRLILENKIRDAKTIAGILRYLLCENGSFS